MKALQVTAYLIFSFLAVGGIAQASGVTGNLIAGCDCISEACIQACGVDGSAECCMASDGTQQQLERSPSWPGYLISLAGMSGIFIMMAMNKQEEDMY